MADELRLPARLMNLDALRVEEDRLNHEIHGLSDRRDAIRAEILIRLSQQGDAARPVQDETS